MKDFNEYCEIFAHTYAKLLLLLQQKTGIILTSLSMLLVNEIRLPSLLIIFFIWLLIDFITGVIASYVEVKNGTKPMPISGYVFESKRARTSGVKIIGYLTVFFFIYMVDIMFFNKKFEIIYTEGKNLTLTEIVVCGGIAIEAYSSIIENMKRAGFDLILKVTNIADNVWMIIKKVKGNG